MRELEEKRINREMAHIRQKFKDGNLDGYQKKKYLAKVVFTYILGYKVDVGHMEAVNLISSTKYSEKQIVCPFAIDLLPDLTLRATSRLRCSCMKTRTSCGWSSIVYAKIWTTIMRSTIVWRYMLLPILEARRWPRLWARRCTG